MKLKITLLLIGFFAFSNIKSQTYSTETVSLFSNGGTDLTYSAKIDVTSTLVTVTLIGPSTSWLGLAFNATGMSDAGRDVILFDGTNFTDRNFTGSFTAPATDATQNWTVTSNTVVSGVRTVIGTRALNTGDANDYVFNFPPNSPLNIAYARRLGSLTVGYHGADSCGTTAVSFNTVLGVNDVNASESKKTVLYPNPAKETVSIKNIDKIKSIDIYESAGRKVRSVKPEGESINVRDLKPGIYYLEITLKDGNLSYEKLIKE